ncbi:uncharacterized protein DDB_G0284459-like [Bolinopsis microptera]|uniref:uncharacterized protein DDB_G0284459-like n=1 Tax=Bolinopsis microptera TaxID=2820187 RepID=UPI003079817E
MKLSETDDATKNDTIVNDERLKSFFESNDERFRKLINEHRQFQLNQRKALFNRALRQTLSQSMVNPIHPGLQAIRTYESADRTDSDNRGSPSSDTQVRNVSRNLPTPRYYVPKRLPKRPTTPRHASFDENNAVILNSPRSPFFNNSFGIKALERRIEEDMRIQSERRKQPGGIQRSISLDAPSSTQNDSLTVTNLNTSSSFTHGTKSRPNFLSPPQNRASNQALTISEAVLLANKKIKDAVDDRDLVRTDPKDPRPPLKRQNKVVAEQKVGDEDLVDQSTKETYLSGSASDSFFQTEMFQDSETKQLSCRQSLVSFNDIVEYLSISTENDSFEENWRMAGELQAMFGQYRSDSIEQCEDVNHENKMMENEENANSGAKENDEVQVNTEKVQNELWGSCARRQRLKDTSWRRLCSDSQDLDIIKTSSKDATTKDSNLNSDIINEEAEPKGDTNHKDRVQVQRTRPGEVKRPKKSLILDKIPTQHSIEENGSTDLSQNLSPKNLTSASSPMSSKSGSTAPSCLSSPLPHSTTSCVSTPSASCVSTPTSISTTSSSNSTGTCGSDCLCHSNSTKKEREFFNFDRQKTMTLGTHEVRVMSPTTSEDQHTYSTDQKSSTSSCGQTSAHRVEDRPAQLETKSRTKSRKIKRVPFNLARISTDSVDEVFTPRNFGE